MTTNLSLLIKTSRIPVNSFLKIFTALLLKVVNAMKLLVTSFLRRIKEKCECLLTK